MEGAGIQSHDTPLAQHHLPHSPSPPLRMMAPDLDMPAQVTDHGVVSNLRNVDEQKLPEPDILEQNVLDQPFPQTLDLTTTASFDEPALYAPFSEPMEPGTPAPISFAHDLDIQNALDQVLDPQPGPVADIEQQQESGYAMLSFPDSYHVFKTLNVVVGRDQNYYHRYQQAKREERRAARRREKRSEHHTQRTLNDYAKEPSQPSQTGDDVAIYASSGSADGEALEGRPARALLSHYSEQGGPVAYNPPSDDEAARFRRRERYRLKPSSSSATSIAPGDLHQVETFTMSELHGEAYTGSAATDNGEDWAALPVHPANADDIRHISREHLIFSYDADHCRWVLHIAGNNAYVGDQLYYKDQRDIPLENGTEIIISTIKIIFRLPITVDDDDSIVSDDDADDHSGDEMVEATSERRLSNDSDDDGEDEEMPELEQLSQKPIKLKLKVAKTPAKEPGSGKGKGKGKGKDQPKAAGKSKTVEQTASDVADPPKQAEKTKKSDDDAAAIGEDVTEAVKAEQARPINILPGSILENLAPDQMPEKRKGPGRPPKNGVLSKRDERAVTRRRKEYERRNMPVPDFNVILAEVREEQKAKDAAAKGNKLRPEGATDAVESIEATDQPDGGEGGQTQPREQASASADPAQPSSLARRPLRSPSPMKPAEAFTEEELKKPTLSYFYLLDEVLQDVGQADLQTIYDKFQKRWPYYKYTVTTTGWQSSIRHNLSQFSRFKAVGKVGKGQLWAIDHDAPREESGTKKKQKSPPPRPPPMANGQMAPGMPQYQQGRPQYAPQYGAQSPYNPGQGQYSSPYGGHPGQYQQQGPHGPPHMQPVNGPHMGHRPPGSHMQQPPPQPPQPNNPVAAITQDIMSFRNVFLARLPPNAPNFDSESAKFFQAVNYFSEIFHGSGDGPEEHPSEDVLNAEPYRSLKSIFDKHGTQKKSAESTSNTSGPNQANGAANHGNAPTAGSDTPMQQVQPVRQEAQSQIQQPMQPLPQQQNGLNGTSMAAPPPSAGTNSGQGSQPSVASQTAAAVAQSANGANGHYAPPVPPPNASANVNALPQPANIGAPPAPVAPQNNAASSLPVEQPVATAPAPTVASVQAPMQPPPALQDQSGSQPPPAAAPTRHESKENSQPPAPALTGHEVKPGESDPCAEQNRPTSAGVKRAAEDIEMIDAESDVKRQKRE